MARSAIKVSASPFQRAAESRGGAFGRGPQDAKPLLRPVTKSMKEVVFHVKQIEKH